MKSFFKYILRRHLYKIIITFHHLKLFESTVFNRESHIKCSSCTDCTQTVYTIDNSIGITIITTTRPCYDNHNFFITVEFIHKYTIGITGPK